MKKVLLVAAILAGGSVLAEVKPGLVAHYEFNGDFLDSSGHGNDGRGRGAEMVADRNGREKSACRFDGEMSCVRIGPSASLDSIKESVTVSAWIRPRAWHPGFFMPIVCKGSFTRCYGLMIYGKGNVWLKGTDSESCFELSRLKRGVNEFARAYSGSSIELDRWQHVAITYGEGVVRAYLNGKLIGKQQVEAPLISERSDLFIGIDPEGGLEYFNGDMDDVRIYSRRLTSNEVEDLFIGDSNWFSTAIRSLVRCFCSSEE